MDQAEEAIIDVETPVEDITEVVSEDEASAETTAKSTKAEKKESESESADPLKDLQFQIDALEVEKVALAQAAESEKDKALRTLAELENFKRRKQQEVDGFKRYAIEQTVLELLPVLDSFDRACDHAKETSDEADDIVGGFFMIQKQFHNVLDKLGVIAIETIDQPFDPNIHQAISQEEMEGKSPDIVIKEMQKGYKLQDKVIRPAMVVVSK